MRIREMAIGIGALCLCATFAPAQQTGQSKPAATTKRPAQAKSALYPVMISTDLDCTLKIDDGNPTDLSVDKPTRMNLPPGDHLLVAVSKDGKDRQSQVVTLDKPAQKVVLVTLLKVQQARAQDERAKKELEDAKAEEAKDELDAAKAQAAKQEQQATQRAQQQQLDAARQQATQDRQKQLSNLRSQIDDLNNQIASDQDEAQEEERSAQEADAQCAQMNLQPGVPCVLQITAGAARDQARRKRQEASELKAQVRDLESQLRDLSTAPLQVQPAQPAQPQQAAAQSAVSQMRSNIAAAPPIDFAQLKGTWRWQGYDQHASAQANLSVVLEFLLLPGGNILVRVTRDANSKANKYSLHLVDALTIDASQPGLPAQYHCVVATYVKDNKPESFPCRDASGVLFGFRLLDSNHLQLDHPLGAPTYDMQTPQVFTKSQ